MRGRLERLPVLALLQLPVPGHHDDEPVPAEPALRERDPASLGDAHPERARAGLDPGHTDVRVAVEPAEATEPQQPFPRDDAEREERRVQPRHVVTLGREEDVTVGVVESALGDVQLVEQEVRDDVERAERRAEVTGAGALHRRRARSAGTRRPGAPASRRGRRRRRAYDRAQPSGRGAGPASTGDRSRRVRPASSGVKRRRRVGVSWRRVRDAIDWLESRVGTRRGGATVFALALLVFGLRSIALPVIPGRDFGTYLGYYVQMWDWHSVVPMAMLFRTPLAPLVIGGLSTSSAAGACSWSMALLFAASVVLWTRTALTFGPRAALVTAVALVVYPGYGILFHTPASEPVAAAAFAVWALALARAWILPGVGRFAIFGAATAATALARPAFEVLVLFAALPLVLRLSWRTRLGCMVACAGVAIAVLGSWTVLNGLRYDDYTLSRAGAFLPFYRAFTTDHIVRPENGPASRELADAVRRELLPRGALSLVRDHAERVLPTRRAARVRGCRRDHRPTLGMGLRLRAHASGRHRGGEGASDPLSLGRRHDHLRGALETALRRAAEHGRRGAERHAEFG